ncbi:MAG: PAS domain-containing protein [Ignavibacteriales bacterium]|nr:MAG: PAS domain-containing protein [Ignavibacteriales bacterium]
MDAVNTFWGDNKEKIITPDGIVVISSEQKIIAFSQTASRLTGYSEDEIILKDYDFIFRNTEFDKNYIIDSLTSGNTFSNLSLNITRYDNTILNVLASLTPITRSDKSIIGLALVFRDTQEMLLLAEKIKERTQALLDEKNKLDAIFNSNIEGTFTIDNEWSVTSFNKSAEKITGFTKEQAINKKCWEIFNSDLCRNGCHMESTMANHQPTIGNELIIKSKEGKLIPIKVNSAPLLNGKGEPIGAVETFIDISEIKNLAEHLSEKYKFANIIGKSKSMNKIYSLLESVAQSDSSVLITGESGTGKELVARAIHLNSDRKNAPFIAINCSAFAESLIESELFGHEKGAFTGAIKNKTGRFELAKDGSLFLDEIGDLSLQLQVKLLRILETRQFEQVGGITPIDLNARIIAATNKDLNKEISEGRFREDLLFRINVINIDLPPLRERMDDFPILINHFLQKFNEKFKKNITGIAANTFKILEKYNWPGNIRELENVIEHGFVLCQNKIIQTEHLPEKLISQINVESDTKTTTSPVLEAEKRLIISTLEKFNGNKNETAKTLGINKSTLWRKMKKFNLE